MKVLLIFPPVSPQFHMPYLSIPALGAYLKQEEPSWGVKMIDANVELGKRVIKPENLTKFKKAFEDSLKDMPASEARTWGEERLKSLIEIENFLKAYPGPWRYRELQTDPRFRWFITYQLKNIEEWLSAVLMNAVSVEHLNHKGAIDWANKYPEGIMTEYYRDELVPAIKAYAPDVIGFSWIDLGQVVPSLILKNMLKQSGVNARTVVGGPYVSLIFDRLKDSPMTAEFDHYVNKQGEEPLVRLCRSVAKGESKDQIGAMMEPIEPDIGKLPPPDFGDYALDDYIGGEKKLCLLGSWGCYWGECSFCNVRRLEGVRYKTRKPEQIVDDMAVIKQKYNPEVVRLSDNAISFTSMVRLAQLLIDKQVNLPWITNSRFDEKWNKDGVDLIARSGCNQLLFGLESAADSVMNLVNKGTDLKLVKDILGLLEPTRIWVHFYMIVGYPTETREDWLRTIEFFKEISKTYPKLRFSTGLAGFGLQIQSHMYHDPKKYHIEHIDQPDPQGWSTICNYRLEPGYADLFKDVKVYAEMKKLLYDVYLGHMANQMNFKERIKNKYFIVRQKIKFLTGI